MGLLYIYLYILESFNVVGNINFTIYSKYLVYYLEQSSVKVTQKCSLLQNARVNASWKVRELKCQRSDTSTKEKVRTPKEVELHTAGRTVHSLKNV
jgi:hypothetical protein